MAADDQEAQVTARCTCQHSRDWHRPAYRGPHSIGQRNVVICEFPGCDCCSTIFSWTPDLPRGQRPRTAAEERAHAATPRLALTPLSLLALDLTRRGRGR